VNLPTYAQARQDLWIVQQFPPGFQGFAVDCGAHDGCTRSNTLLLEDLRWTVLCIEANPQLAPYLKRNRPFVQMCAVGAEAQEKATLHVHDSNPEAHTALKPITNHKDWHPEKGARWSKVEVPVRTLDDLLDQAEFPRLDVLCIDVEGGEGEVLRGIDLKRWTPSVICVEAWDAGKHDDHLLPLGYKRVARLLVDDLYKLEEA
jgi:FkbM family methyltransferase